MTALSDRHFQQGSQGESASKRPTLLAAAQEVGLDVAKVEAFLDSDELHDEVWRSYGEMPRKGITGIPLFCFSIPEAGLWSGPFREANADATINGSANKAHFLHLFEQLYKFATKALGDKLKRDRPPNRRASAGAGGRQAGRRGGKARPPGSRASSARRCGLSASRPSPELNGAAGVCERFDKAQGRYAVRLAGQEKPIAVKGANLELVDAGDGDAKDEL